MNVRMDCTAQFLDHWDWYCLVKQIYKYAIVLSWWTTLVLNFYIRHCVQVKVQFDNTKYICIENWTRTHGYLLGAWQNQQLKYMLVDKLSNYIYRFILTLLRFTLPNFTYIFKKVSFVFQLVVSESLFLTLLRIGYFIDMFKIVPPKLLVQWYIKRLHCIIGRVFTCNLTV